MNRKMNDREKVHSIFRFVRENAFLSSFYPCRIDYEGIIYSSLEHAFHAAKTLSQADKERIAACDTPGQAKRLGRRVALRPDWNEVRLLIMLELLRQKFFENPKLAKKLLATGDKYLIEGNDWGDRFWGAEFVGQKWVGKNHLGRLLMQVRDELRAMQTVDELEHEMK